MCKMHHMCVCVCHTYTMYIHVYPWGISLSCLFFRATVVHRMSSCESLYRGMSYLQKQSDIATPTKVKAVGWGFRNLN